MAVQLQTDDVYDTLGMVGPELELYERMLLIREFEDTVKFLFLEGTMPGTIHQCQGQEATAVGAAMVAGVGTGFFADFTAASVAVRLAPAAIYPDPEATKTYADGYRRYLATFDAVESVLAQGDSRPT